MRSGARRVRNAPTAGPIACTAGDAGLGATLGNPDCCARTDTLAGLDHLWVAATGRWRFGAAEVACAGPAGPLAATREVFEPTAMRVDREAGPLSALQRLLVAPEGAAVYLWLRVRNRGAAPALVTFEGRGAMHAMPSPMHRQQPPPADVRARFTPIATSARALRAAGPDGEVLEIASSSGVVHGGERTWLWRDERVVEAGGRVDAWVRLAVLGSGDHIRPLGAPRVHAELRRRARALDSTAAVSTPSALVDASVAWGKRGAHRVSHRFRHGSGFTNDPPGTIIVTRDAVWFALGADHFDPGFVRAMLEAVLAHARYPSGKIAEYVDLGSTPVHRADYGLNIADPTPLLLLAMHHHAAATGDLAWLGRHYGAVRGAADYLLSQTRGDLVYCTTHRAEANVGQCGWRNVVDGIRIAGAVTELQAESSAALSAAAAIAREVGEEPDATRFAAAAERLAAALSDRLVDPRTGRYRLALDADDPDPAYGSDDTVDQVFPALLGLAPAALEERTARRLLGAGYRSRHGIRTAPRGSPGYHPRAQWGLVGGIWPNASAWAASAVARVDPTAAFRLAETAARPLFDRAPRPRGALAPGEFPEWLDGDTGVSLGMAMSPWMPPTFVWLVVERLIGVRPTLSGLAVLPCLPPGWSAAVRGARHGGAPLSVLVTPQAIYSTQPVAISDRPVRLAEDRTPAAWRRGIVMGSGTAETRYRPSAELRVSGAWEDSPAPAAASSMMPW